MGKMTSNTLLKGLIENASSLDTVVRDFARIAITQKLQIRCFYETLETHIAKAVMIDWLAKRLPKVKVRFLSS